jgi:hypothetical protein
VTKWRVWRVLRRAERAGRWLRALAIRECVLSPTG